MRETQEIAALTAVTTGTSNAFACHAFDRAGMSCQWATGVTAGVVALEWAPTASYSGTWKNLLSLDAASVTPAAVDGDAVDVVGGFVRARVTSTVNGGGAPSVTVVINLARLSQ